MLKLGRDNVGVVSGNGGALLGLVKAVWSLMGQYLVYVGVML